ncbi:MAG TPA: PIN domain-containing protein [Candidatus Sulfotelmatobacter sp.]|jgi:predicted nucleic acid-binding protein|nr:PIN domain-containing protein [Candidatus Sulfotelmatobacter sp.]
MDRLFLDANVLFSAAYMANARLRELWRLRDVELWTSRYALEEARVNLSDEVQRQRLLELSEPLQFREARERRLPARVALPEKDAPILLAAIEAGANYLLTGDVHRFGQYFGKKVEGVTVLPPARYLKIKNRKARH